MLLAPAVAALCIACGGPAGEPATLVLRGGTVVTLDETRPRAEALAMRDGTVVFVGDDREVERRIGPDTEVIDLDGRTAVPGLADAHVHLEKLGRVRMNLDLTVSETWEEIVQQVAQAVKETPTGRWIYGRGWHQDKWASAPDHPVDGYPVHDTLSSVSPQHPVLLRHASGHGAMVNRSAMERLGIAVDTADPLGGVIVRDANGRATGMMLEKAEDPFRDAFREDGESLGAEEARAVRKREFELAFEECLAKGLTSVHQAGLSFDDIDVLTELYEQAPPGVRVHVMIDADFEMTPELLDRYRRTDDPWINVRAIKQYMDGALGSRGAWLLEPYDDLPDSVGAPVNSLEELEQSARLALTHDYQFAVHAIGDRGNRELLDLYERVTAAAPDPTALRWRIEHAQHLADSDIPRFAERGVIASIQTCHCTSDAPWVPHRLGEQRSADGAYPWRKLIDSGALVVGGTDAPVEDIDPIRNFHSAVTRATADGNLFHPEQRMTREEALRSITVDAAYAAFDETRRGRLAPGQLADVVVLSGNPLTVPDDEILGIQVDLTIVDGVIRYRRP